MSDRQRSTWGGRRPGAGRKKVDPAELALRHPGTARRQAAERVLRDPLRWLRARLWDDLHDDATDFEKHLFIYPPDATLREGWERDRASILRRWIRARPGTRPSTWWFLDAPEPRAQVEGPRSTGSVTAFSRGIPWGGWWPFDPRSLPVYESEARFLARHKLLGDAEAARLSSPDFEPQALPRDLWPDHNDEGGDP